MTDRQAVCAVVVTYQPDRPTLLRLIEATRPQVAHIVVVDNGSREDVGAWVAGPPNVAFLPLGENRGIAAAQNAGIRHAREVGASHVLIFDHDSEPAPDMVVNLLAAMAKMETAGYRVAAVGPRYRDVQHDNKPPFLRTQGLLRRRCHADDPQAIVPVDYLISSGSLIALSTLEEVGPMREEFFIDYVDNEWGLRARAKGFQSFGVYGAHMRHQLGDRRLPFLGITVPCHSPLRQYYIVRNALWLYGQSYAPFNWKIVDAVFLTALLLIHLLASPDRRRHAAMIAQGARDAFRGRSGGYPGHG